MCHGLRLKCHRQPYRDALPSPEIEVAHDLSILRNTQLVTSLLGSESKHMQLMIRDLY